MMEDLILPLRANDALGTNANKLFKASWYQLFIQSQRTSIISASSILRIPSPLCP